MENKQISGVNDAGLIWLCYALYGLGFFSGWITSIIAVIINYIACKDQREPSSLLVNHMQWQIATFWRAVVYIIACLLITFALTITIVGMIFTSLPWIALAIWYIYRLVRGVLALHRGEEVAPFKR